MPPFDYLVQLITILVGLALADLALSLHRLLRARARVRWHWFPLAAAALLVLLTLDMWWGLREFSLIKRTLTIGLFLPFLVELLILFLLAAAALPDDVPGEGLDLRCYYFENGRYFWGLFAGFLALLAAHRIGFALIVGPPDRLGRVLTGLTPHAVLFLLACSLATVRRGWWHGLVLFGLLLVFLVSWAGRPLV